MHCWNALFLKFRTSVNEVFKIMQPIIKSAHFLLTRNKIILNNMVNRRDIPMFDIAHTLKSGNCDFSTFTDFVIVICDKKIFGRTESVQILNKLKQLKDMKKYYGNIDHPSVIAIINRIGHDIAKTCLSLAALPFFMEQLRIEKQYLGCYHPDLASILFDIGEIYEENDELVEAKEYFKEALHVLENNKRKGRLYAKLMHNLGLVNHRQSFYKEAIDKFNLAILEHEALHGEFDPIVAEIRIQTGQCQLEIGQLQDALDNFLQALIITRMTHGNNHSDEAKCLFGIGLIHEAKSEFRDAFDVLHQAFTIIESVSEDDDNFAQEILHRISLVCQSMEDKSNEVIDKMSDLLKLNIDGDVENHVFIICGFEINGCTPEAAAAA